MTIQLWISRAQNNKPWLGWVFPVEEHHQAQATPKRLVPHHGGIQMQMRFLFHSSEVLETAQVLEVDFPVILPPCPATLRVWPSVEKPAVGIAPQFGDGVQIKSHDFSNIFLLRIVAVHTMIFDARRQAMSMRTQLLRVEVDPGLFLLGLRGVLSRRRLRDRERTPRRPSRKRPGSTSTRSNCVRIDIACRRASNIIVWTATMRRRNILLKSCDLICTPSPNCGAMPTAGFSTLGHTRSVAGQGGSMTGKSTSKT